MSFTMNINNSWVEDRSNANFPETVSDGTDTLLHAVETAEAIAEDFYADNNKIGRTVVTRVAINGPMSQSVLMFVNGEIT